MALQITITDQESNVTLTDSYHKVTGMLDDRLNGSMQIRISIYKGATEKDANQFIRQNGKPFYSIECAGEDYTTYFSTTALGKSGVNPVKSSYAFLKAIDLTTMELTDNYLYDYKNDSTDI